jgi:hypothetical protein
MRRRRLTSRPIANSASIDCGEESVDPHPQPLPFETGSTVEAAHFPAWQLIPAGQAGRLPSGAPRPSEHFPMLPATSHASHCPSQARSQQTPSTQSPLAHSRGAPQSSPWAFP